MHVNLEIYQKALIEIRMTCLAKNNVLGICVYIIFFHWESSGVLFASCITI